MLLTKRSGTSKRTKHTIEFDKRVEALDVGYALIYHTCNSMGLLARYLTE